MDRTVSPPAWVVEETVWQPARNQAYESLFALANGYLGVRGFPEEPFDAGPTCPEIYLAGVFDPGPDGIPELVPVANFLAVEVSLGGRAVRLADGRVREYRRVLDLRRGLLRRGFVYADAGRATRLEFERFTSVANPHLAGQSVTVTPLDWTGEVAVCLWMDAAPRRPERAHLALVHAAHVGRGRILMAAETRRTKVRIGHAVRGRAWVRQAAPPGPRHVGGGDRIGLRFETVLECGQRAVFDRLVATYTSRDQGVASVERSCLEDLRDAEAAPYGVRRRRHVRGWRRRWDRADLVIDGPEDDQRAVRFAVFHLLQSAPPRGPLASIAAKGLSGPGYRGHVFWDTEIFMLPFFVCAAPGAARRLLDYRVRTLDGARRKARAAGYRGAMFAWESADTGDETCPPCVPDPRTGRPVRVLTGDLQHHVTADVVYAAWHYVLASGDGRWRERQLLRLAVETARFWAGRVRFDRRRRRHEIPGVIGPDEYHERVDNNAYTNYLAAWNLRLAADEVVRMRTVHARSHLLRRLAVTDDELARWRAVADHLVVPVDEGRGLLEQHEGFFGLEQADPRALSSRVSDEPEQIRMRRIRRAQVLKQADVLMLMVLFPDAFTRRVRRRNWDYYEPRTTHDSSLSPSIHAIAACDLGLAGPAYRYFRRSAFLDLDDTMGNTDSGLHFAALGGTWQAVVRGFLGLRVDGPAPVLRPRLPAAWRKVTTHVRHRRQWYAIEVTRDAVHLCRSRA